MEQDINRNDINRNGLEQNNPIDNILQFMMEMRGEVDIQPEKDGLADEIRDILPTFAFKKDNFKNSEDEEKLECRICFCEFNEDDMMR